MTHAGELTENDDGSGSWKSSDGSQSGNWDADGNGTFSSPQGDGEMTVTHDAEGGISFTDSMGASGSFAEDGSVTLQISGEDDEGSGLDETMDSAFSDPEKPEDGTSPDTTQQALDQAETEVTNADNKSGASIPGNSDAPDDFTYPPGSDDDDEPPPPPKYDDGEGAN